MLKDLNKTKKDHEEKAANLDKQIKRTTRESAGERLSLEQRFFAALEHARTDTRNPIIQISGEAWTGTVLGGVRSELTLSEGLENFTAQEIHNPGEEPAIQIQTESPVSP